MSKNDTSLDEINHVCSIVDEIIELLTDIRKDKSCADRCLPLIESKIKTIQKKAQKMEDRLKLYRSAIEDLGYKRVKKKK